MRKRISGLVFVMAAIAVNSAWAQGPGIVDPVRSVAANVYACTLNAGKTMADVNAVQKTWLSAAEEGEHNGFTVQLRPRYGNVQYDVIWIDYLPIDQLAQSSEWWDDNAREVTAAIFEVVSCHATLNTNRLDYLNEALPEDGDGTGFFFWKWCTPREGVTRAALAASRREFVQRLSDMSVRGASSRMFPFLGIRAEDRLGQFADTFMSPDWAAVAAYHEYYATGGWRIAADYNENVAQCIGTNVYDLTVLNRPHSPWVE